MSPDGPDHALGVDELDRGRLDTLLELSAGFQALSHQTADHREAVQAFLDKRTPVFSGN